MAPQNSTLLQQEIESYHNDDISSTATSEKITPGSCMQDLVSNYSPILRPKSAGDPRYSDTRPHRPYYVENVVTVEDIFIPPSTQKKSIFAKNTIKNGKTCDEEELDIPYSDDFNSSWYENDPEFDDDEQEIPIWIRGEPRFVSGISSVTTCNDVIAALINDEISSGQYSKIEEVRYSVDDYIITERWRDVESELDGNELILPIFMAWGEAQTEMKFKLKINKKKIEEGKTEKIEKKLEKKEKMTMVTKLMRRVLKQGDYIQKHLFVLKDKKDDSKPNRYNKNSYNKKLFYENYLARNSNGTLSTVIPSACSSIERLYCKCCGGNQNSLRPDKRLKITDNLRVRPCPEPKMLENISLEPLDEKLRAGHTFEDNVRTDDELLLVIENDEVEVKPGHVDNDSGNGSIGKSSEGKVVVVSDASTSSDDAITVTPKRKHRSLRDYDSLRKHSLNNRKILEKLDLSFPSFDETKFRNANKNRGDKFDGIRFEIMLKMSEMKQLLVREEMLLTQIQMQCAKYRAENELYNSRKHVDDLRVDEIQNNLEVFAREIVENEQELFATKLEVEQKAKTLHELKALLEVRDSEEEMRKEMIMAENRAKVQEQRIRRRASMEKLEFIDNIYEFCDNNKSVLI